MYRDSKTAPVLIDLGAASVETQGPTGAPVDEIQGFLPMGLSDD